MQGSASDIHTKRVAHLIHVDAFCFPTVTIIIITVIVIVTDTRIAICHDNCPLLYVRVKVKEIKY